MGVEVCVVVIVMMTTTVRIRRDLFNIHVTEGVTEHVGR